MSKYCSAAVCGAAVQNARNGYIKRGFLPKMETEKEIIRSFPWQDFSAEDEFRGWRQAKIRSLARLSELPEIRMDSLLSRGGDALSALKDRCAIAHYALYRVAEKESETKADCQALATFSRSLGFSLPEDHRSAGASGVVALRTSSEPSKRGYIPYTTRPLNWHTDGYYNPGSAPVKAFILHCHRQAATGGENQIADPEAAYLRMREANPEFVQALMHPEAMTIPENLEPDGTLRPASVGPVFFADERSGRLQMRYTARTRSIEWRDDATTRKATEWLKDWLQSDDPLIRSFRLESGQGIVSNNVLHNRTGFDDGTGAESERVMLRVRFHERLTEDHHGAA